MRHQLDPVPETAATTDAAGSFTLYTSQRTGYRAIGRRLQRSLSEHQVEVFPFRNREVLSVMAEKPATSWADALLVSDSFTKAWLRKNYCRHMNRLSSQPYLRNISTTKICTPERRSSPQVSRSTLDRVDASGITDYQV